MCFAVQCALAALLALSAYVVIGICHGTWLVAGIVGWAIWLALLIRYFLWQNQHPDWYAPWDEGLPCVTRVLNAVVPVIMIFTLAMILCPVFIQVHARNMYLRHHPQDQANLPNGVRP